jgi:hypothetical protein
MSDPGAEAEAEHKRTRIIELVEVAVLAIVAVMTAWSGYQGTQWGGRQSQLYAEASSTRLQAEALSTHAGQVLVADATIFTAWLEAHEAKNHDLETLLERRFTPEYHDAFEQWLATDPFSDPNAPAGPAAMPGFTTKEFEQAAAMNAQASALLNEGTAARETGNRYVRGTVLFASVLLLIAIAQRFKTPGIRTAANLLALALLAYALYSVLRLPRM